MTPASVSYYTDEVAGGLEDYYAGRGEAQGVWVGSGSACEGLRGEVDAVELARLFEGRHPASGDSLGAVYKVREGADRVTGWDLTFSAPKSVSVLWAVGGGDVGMEARAAHDAAVTAAVDYLEEHATFSRTGKAGVRQVDTAGLLAAAFVHRSSRAGDPQLHTHVLVSGRVRCDDGVWRALDSRALHRQLKPAGMVYQAALRAELTARLGVSWSTVDRNGQAEVEGVPLGARRLFAQRRAAVEVRAAEVIAEREDALGRVLTPEERRRAFERAVLETRDAKDHAGESDGGLHDRWLAEATKAGFAPGSWIPDTVERRGAPPSLAVEAVAAEVVAELAAARSTWRRSDAVRHAVRRVPVGVGGAEAARRWVESVADAVVEHASVVGLKAPEPRPPAELTRRDGRSVFARHDATRYTTLATLEAEQHVLDLAEVRPGRARGVADITAVDRAIAAHDLDYDQAGAVRFVTGSGDTVSCVVGPAGTGKSRAMRAAAHAWTESGTPVRGLAVSAVAAGVLAEEARIPAETIAKFLYEHDRPEGRAEGWRLRRGEVVVVDEAGMVASGDLARLAVLADAAEAKLVLVGDHAQLGAVEAGGLFRLLADTHAVHLGGVRRFTHRWERDASLRLRAGDTSVIDLYDRRARIIATDRLGVLDHAARRWVDAHAAGESLVVCATDNATVSAICDTIRSARVAAGEVEPGGVHAAGQVVGVGDEIVTVRNDRRLATTTGGWVRNGDRWHVTHRHDDGSITASHTAGHGTVRLPADYVAEHVHLGYALTVHKAQGVTVDHALLVADDTTTAESLYVGMTRGRHNNTALVVADTLDPDLEQRRGAPTTARDLLVSAMGRVASEEAAITALRSTLAASDSLAVLAPRLANVQAQIARETPDNPEPELRRLVAQREYLERRARPGILTRAGRHDRQALRDLDDRIETLGEARDARYDWLAEHAGLFAYRDALAQQVTSRRQALGAAAVAEQPRHLVDLLGPVPDDDAGRTDWASRAGRVEAYREQWGIEPGDIGESPVDDTQRREWTASIQYLETLRRLDTHPVAERGIGLEL